MSYKVVAPLVLARDHEDKVHHYYAGAVINWLPKDQREHFLELGLVEKVGAVDDPVDDEPGDEKPGAEANKPELVDWIAANVAKHDGSDYTKTELRKMSPEDLRAIVDAVED